MCLCLRMSRLLTTCRSARAQASGGHKASRSVDFGAIKCATHKHPLLHAHTLAQTYRHTCTRTRSTHSTHAYNNLTPRR